MKHIHLVLTLGVLLVFLPMLSEAITHHVNMQDFFFDPDTVIANEGDTVLWVNHGAVGHTTTSGAAGVPDGYWDSGLLPPMGQFTFVFDPVGTFPYYCTPHWPLGMVGIIFVNSVSVDEVETNTPQVFHVSQNYPNPFTYSTRINYELSVPAMTEIVIYNTSGQFIQKLVNRYMVSGKYSVVWDGRDSRGAEVPTGLYLYQLKFDNTVIRRHMLVVR